MVATETEIALACQDESRLSPQEGGCSRYNLMSNHARGKKEGAAADLGAQLKVPGSVALARASADMAARRSTAAISSPNPAATRRP